jgi:hypothetical protein
MTGCEDPIDRVHHGGDVDVFVRVDAGHDVTGPGERDWLCCCPGHVFLPPVSVDVTLTPAGGQDCHGDALERLLQAPIRPRPAVRLTN